MSSGVSRNDAAATRAGPMGQGVKRASQQQVASAPDLGLRRGQRPSSFTAESMILRRVWPHFVLLKGQRSLALLRKSQEAPSWPPEAPR
eukprot:3716803-Pyramimonas_sp.AAC.1